MYVYKITNLINQKNYIGITNNYKKRWSNEKCLPKDEKRQQLINKKIQEYGKNNFQFEVLFSNLTIEEACQKEQELIIKYNSLVPNGYNIDKGGNYHPHYQSMYGEKNGKSKLTDKEAQYIKDHRNQPMYVLYDEFSDIISYESFKKCYKHQTYTHLTPKVEEYPYNTQFSNQFSDKGLEYDQVLDIRERYANGEYWKDVYKDYKNIFSNEMSFWRAYTGLSYKLVKPEVFNEKNKKIHASLKRSGSNNSHAKLTAEDVKTIRKLHKEGKTNKELYTLYPQVSTVAIRDIINYKTWKKII